MAFDWPKLFIILTFRTLFAPVTDVGNHLETATDILT